MKNLLDGFFSLLQKIGTERRYQVSFGVSTAGLTMIISSHLLDGHSEWHVIRTILLEIGIACIIAAIAEFLLLKHASDVFRQEVQEDIKILEGAVATFQQEVRQDMKLLELADQTFRQEVRQDMKILSHCLEHQLVDVMPPLNKSQENMAVQEINSAIENARGEVRIIAFTLRDILNNRTSLGAPLRRLLNSNGKIEVKLLLIDPTSDAAHIRVMAEEGSDTLFEKSDLHGALQSNFFLIKEMVDSIAKQGGIKSIEALFYNVLPNFYMVSTPNEVFIEPYHLGRKCGGDSTIGGVVPLFRFSSKSPMYEFAQSHFSFIWDSQKRENAAGNGGPHKNGYIRIKTMDEVNREIERRLGRSERRSRVSQANTERRSPLERRHTTHVKVRGATV